MRWRLGVVGANTLSAKPVAEVVREGLLDEAVFAVDVSDHLCRPERLYYRAHCTNGAIQIEPGELLFAQHRTQLRFQLPPQLFDALS